jgi:hypothetical protein
MRSKMTLITAAVGVVLLQAGSAYATAVVPAPEVSPSSLSAGLAALTGGILILRAWRRRS